MSARRPRRSRRELGAHVALVLAIALAACSGRGAHEARAPGGIGDPRDREASARGDPAAFILTTGEPFEIRLPANPSTGFQWELGSKVDDSVVRKVASSFEPDPSGKIGGGGTAIWRFVAVGPGRTHVVLLYRRAWEPEVAPAKIAVYSVVVED